MYKKNSLVAALFAGLLACGGGGDGGGGVGEERNLNGQAFICAGAFVHEDGRRMEFPCRGDSTECVPLDDATVGIMDCTPSGKEKALPGFDTATKVHENLCACIDPDVPLTEQPGSCQSVCERVIEEGLLFGGEAGWRCEAPAADMIPAGQPSESRPHTEGSRPNTSCTHGSVVYFNGGPADYAAQLFGRQTTSGSDAGFERSDSSDVDAWVEYSIGDRTEGCADGCPFQISELSLIVHPFELEGVSVLFFSWPGLDIDTSTLVSQGLLNGLVYDDGFFSIPSGGGQLNIEYSGSESAAFYVPLSQALTGHVDFATGAIEIDTIVHSQGKGQMRISGLSGAALRTPPSAVISTPDQHECIVPEATEVVLDASGSTDSDGGNLHHRWILDGANAGVGEMIPVSLTLGQHDLKLTSTDNTLGRTGVLKTIEVVDTTPPAFGTVEEADFTTCDAQVDRHALTPPPVTDGCTGVASIEVFLAEENGNPLTVLRQLDIDAAALPDGEGTLLWVATDAAGNQAAAYQYFEVGAAIVAESHLEIRDRATILQASGELGVVAALGNSQSQFGVESRLLEVQTIGPQFFQNRAYVSGLARSQSDITTQHGADIAIEEPYTDVSLVSLPWLEGIATPSGGHDVNVPPDQTHTLTSPNVGTVHVYSRSTLVVPFTDVSIRELWLEPNARVVFTSGDSRMIVGHRWVHRGTIEGDGTLEVYVTGQEVLLERPVEGISVLAPNAKVTVTTMANGSRFGLLVGDVIEVQPDVTLWCDRQAQLP